MSWILRYRYRIFMRSSLYAIPIVCMAAALQRGHTLTPKTVPSPESAICRASEAGNGIITRKGHEGPSPKWHLIPL